MLAACLTLFLSQASGFDLSYSPVPLERYALIQSSYAIHEGSLVEKITFDFSVETLRTKSGYDSTISKMLAEHIFGEEKLDLPAKNEPLKNVISRSIDGTIDETDLDPANAESFRLDRLTAFLPPIARVAPGESWMATVPFSESAALPKIQYKYTLKSATASVAKIAVEVEELDTNNPLRAKGVFSIEMGREKQRYAGGEWTTESAFMPGGSEERFRLVQRIVPKGKN